MKGEVQFEFKQRQADQARNRMDDYIAMEVDVEDSSFYWEQENITRGDGAFFF